MKCKLLLVFAILGLLWTPVDIVTAQNYTNTYSCYWDFDEGDDGACLAIQPGSSVDPNQCATGFEHRCGEITDPDTCDDTFDQACVNTLPEEETRWTWQSGNCIPTPDGEFASEEDCRNSNAQKRYKCVSPEVGCEECNPVTDSSCSLTDTQCANSCKAGNPMYKCNIEANRCETCEEGTPGCNLVLDSCNDICRPSTNAPEVTCGEGSGVQTAIGCIPFDPVNLTLFFLAWALGIGGGIALLMIVYAAFIIMTSSGDPKKVQGGKELITAAISGLLLIIFSTFVLRLLGVDILPIF